VISAIGPVDTPAWQNAFLQRHQLDTSYLATALKWFTPLTQNLAEHQNGAKRPLLVALNGCQGSGKSTLADFLCTSLATEHGLNAVTLSLDDFYLTAAERTALAQSVHPLLLTRGVPGTHDMALLRHTLKQLLDTQRPEPVAIPRFNKAEDDRHQRANWDDIAEPVQIILLEGWCLGALPQSSEALSQPLNQLERNEDPDARWRQYSNAVLESQFLPIYALVDQWIMLCAPAFDCVFRWRQEQERKLAASLPVQKSSKLMDDIALQRFVQHYERITRQCLRTMPEHINHLYELDQQRKVRAYRHRRHVDALK
jgi:D-glycerate 3-kinase